MVEKKLTIRNRLGLHARPAALLVETASKYDSDVFIIKNGFKVNGKSIMGVLMLAAEMGSELTVQAKGKDADEAVQAMEDLFNNKFHEE
jgi:phosphocarrier protein HPr